MKNNQYEEKIQLISKLMDSYRLSNPYKDDTWFTDKFDKLYDMELEALKYLADIRKIKTKNLVEY